MNLPIWDLSLPSSPPTYEGDGKNTHLSTNTASGRLPPFRPNCGICYSDRHVTTLHIDGAEWDASQFSKTGKKHGEEQEAETSQRMEPPDMTNRCTKACGQNTIGIGRSCATICLADVYDPSTPHVTIRTYIIIDDQSNHSLPWAKLFDKLNIKGSATSYTLKTCSGVKQTLGRPAHGLVTESLDKQVRYQLPTLTECDEIPNNREEIPTPEVARAHPHLFQIANKIPTLDKEAEVLLLVGRDIPALHKIHESHNWPRNVPWSQRLDLGWVVLGKTCLNGAHKPVEISTFKTQVLYNGQPSLFIPCPNRFYLKHDISPTAWGKQEENTPPIGSPFDNGLGCNVFVRTNHDNEPGISTEDPRFLKIMEDGMKKNENGSWEAPLPFWHDVKDLPSSRVNAMKCLKSTRRTLDKNPVMKEQYFSFMQKIFNNDHAEIAPQEDLRPDKVCWYLPHFGIYHPKKKDKIRVVFDSAAESNGCFLTSCYCQVLTSLTSFLGCCYVSVRIQLLW